jgi:hypothetical protein
MDVRPLRNEQDYDWAMREVARYIEIDPALGTPDGDRFEVLAGKGIGMAVGAGLSGSNTILDTFCLHDRL